MKKGYSTNALGEKVHLQQVRELFIEDGGIKIRYNRRQSSFAPPKTSCGRFSNGGRIEKISSFKEVYENNPEICCQVCVRRLETLRKQAKELKNRINH